MRQRFAEVLRDIGSGKRAPNKFSQLSKYLKVPLKKKGSVDDMGETSEDELFQDEFSLGSSYASSEDENEYFDPPPPDPSPNFTRKSESIAIPSSPNSPRRSTKSSGFFKENFIFFQLFL